MAYKKLRGYSVAKPTKSNTEKFLSADQAKKLLDTIAGSTEACKRRDHAAIFCGFYLGLRIGECVLLEKNHFRDLGRGIIYVPTLKKRNFFYVNCPHCSHPVKAVARSIGRVLTCKKEQCQGQFEVPEVELDNSVPETQLPIVEPSVVAYLKSYLKTLSEDSPFLFRGGTHRAHMCVSQLSRIFSTYIEKAGLSNFYSWHSLRHGRAVALYNKSKDLVTVRDMLRHTSVKTTEIYTHMSEDAMRRVTEMDEDVADDPFEEQE